MARATITYLDRNESGWRRMGPGGAEEPTAEWTGLRRRFDPSHVRVMRRQDPLWHCEINS